MNHVASKPIDTAALSFRPLDRAAASVIYHWRYPAPFDSYNLDQYPRARVIGGLLDPQHYYYRIDASGFGLCAFCCYGRDSRVPGGPYGQAALDIGLGVEPTCTGRGLGVRFAQAVITHGQALFPDYTLLRVSVAEFNDRALNVWRRCGFVEAGAFERSGDKQPFLALTRGRIPGTQS